MALEDRSFNSLPLLVGSQISRQVFNSNVSERKSVDGFECKKKDLNKTHYILKTKIHVAMLTMFTAK